MRGVNGMLREGVDQELCMPEMTVPPSNAWCGSICSPLHDYRWQEGMAWASELGRGGATIQHACPEVVHHLAEIGQHNICTSYPWFWGIVEGK